MRTMSFILFFLLFGAIVKADSLRQEITDLRKQKEMLILEYKQYLNEIADIQILIQNLVQCREDLKASQKKKQNEIAKALPLLARLHRSNPLRFLIDPSSGQSKERGVVLTRFLISSIKNKMKKITLDLNEIDEKEKNLNLKTQEKEKLLHNLKDQTIELSKAENLKIDEWKKEELHRLDKEEDTNTLLEESRSIAHSNKAASAEAAAKARGLPFRKLDHPVGGKGFKDPTLQKKFSPYSIGLFFKAKRNEKVTAPAKGEIVFKGPFRNHAEILIIDHGESTHTILMGMHKIDAEVGKKVYAGQKIGTMAGYGSGLPHLYLELRHKGGCIDPSPYFVMK